VSRSLAERSDDVRRLVAAARAVARDDGIARALVETTGLSREGVALALAEHLETSPSEDEIGALVAGAGDASTVGVVLSANVFTASLRALAVARAAAPRVTVTPSSREPVFARALVESARDPGLTLSGGADLSSVEEVHVYGRDETVADIRARVPASVRVRGHGAGFGVACVTRDDTLADAAFAIARDVVPFDQRGCLSPRIVVSIGDGAKAERLSAELHRSLASLELDVPRGRLEPDEREAAVRYASTLEYAGRLWAGKVHVVGLAAKGAPLWLPPPGRHVHVVVVASVAGARELLSGMARYVAAVGCDDVAVGGELVDHLVRTSELGRMQKPPFDGPVDLR
jgi:hypothetical protein